MNRLTTDNPKDNCDTLMNYVYGDNGWARVRLDRKSKNIPLTEWAKSRCLSGCGVCRPEEAEELFGESISQEEVDVCLTECYMHEPDCVIGMAYLFACQAVHLRSRLKMYEDACYSADGKEMVEINNIRDVKLAREPNNPLTKAELKDLFKGQFPGADPVILCLVYLSTGIPEDSLEFAFGIPGFQDKVWCMFDGENFISKDFIENIKDYGKNFIVYRRWPKGRFVGYE